MSSSPPTACNLSALDSEALDEHEHFSELVLGSVTEIQEQPDGYAFRLPTETEMIRRAATFIVRERRCCPFFDFTLQVERDEGPVWLSVSGREGSSSTSRTACCRPFRRRRTERASYLSPLPFAKL